MRQTPILPFSPRFLVKTLCYRDARGTLALAYELSKYASSEFLAWAIRAHDVNG